MRGSIIFGFALTLYAGLVTGGRHCGDGDKSGTNPFNKTFVLD